MEEIRIDWWDFNTGDNYIADLIDGRWDVGVRRWAGAEWHEVKPTEALLARLNQELTARLAETQ